MAFMIVKAGLLLFRGVGDEKELLFVRPKGKPYFVFPGGKQENGETVEEALQRELQEELGTGVANVRKLGVVLGQTPDGRNVQMHLYSAVLLGEPRPFSEIEEIAWMSKGEIDVRTTEMTPMTLVHVLPFLSARAIW